MYIYIVHLLSTIRHNSTEIGYRLVGGISLCTQA